MLNVSQQCLPVAAGATAFMVDLRPLPALADLAIRCLTIQKARRPSGLHPTMAFAAEWQLGRAACPPVEHCWLWIVAEVFPGTSGIQVVSFELWFHLAGQAASSDRFPPLYHVWWGAGQNAIWNLDVVIAYALHW